MSNETTPQRLLATPVSAPELPALDLHEIQGDVLIGLQKNYERFIFFKIVDVTVFKSALRKRIAQEIRWNVAWGPPELTMNGKALIIRNDWLRKQGLVRPP